MIGTKILAVGAYAPQRVVDNDYFATFLDTSDEWIYSRSGIRRRHIATGEATWQMGEKAARVALEKAGIEADSIDMIIGTTVTGDTNTPAMANTVQKALDAKNAVSFDINAACTAFIFAIDMANTYIAMGRAKRVMIVSSERISKMVSFHDRSTCVLFGDGAGCLILEADEQSPSIVSCIHTEIDKDDVLINHTLDTTSPLDTKDLTIYVKGLEMKGREVYKFAVNAMVNSVKEVLQKAGMTMDDIDLVISHQANERIVRTAADKLHFPIEQVALYMSEYGNTSSASIPISMVEMEQEGRLKKGQKIILAGFGAGLTYGAALLHW